MKEFKGTKGKWEVCEHSWSDTSLMAGDKSIATQSIYDDATEENQEELENEVSANFRLLSASKDLLEACIEFVRKVDAGEARSTKSYNQMKQAINKALGGESE